MIDINVLRDQPDNLKASLARRGVELDVDRMVELEAAIRAKRRQGEEVRAEQKTAGKAIATLPTDEKPAAIEAAGKLSERYKELTAEVEQLEADFQALWDQVPNLAHESAPDGASDEDNVEFKRWGEPREFDFEVRDHQDLGEALDVIDIAAGVRLSGSRFAYLKGQAVFLEMALVRWALDNLAGAGFTPVIPPVLVREQALYGTGFFPGDREQVYALSNDDLYLVGTSEVALAALHADDILEEDSHRDMSASRPVSAARPVPTARTRAGSSGFTNSTRWRCSRSVIPTRAGTSTSSSSRWKRSSCRHSSFPTGW